jgi:hypothetical protein
MIVSVNTTAPHPAVIYVECYKEVDCTMPLIIKLPALNLPTTYGLFSPTTTKRLYSWFLVHADDQLTTLIKPLYTLITP